MCTDMCPSIGPPTVGRIDTIPWFSVRQVTTAAPQLNESWTRTVELEPDPDPVTLLSILLVGKETTCGCRRRNARKTTTKKSNACSHRNRPKRR